MYMEYLQQYNKAFVPLIVASLLLVANQFGITEDMTVGEVLTYLVTSFFVYLVPNKK